MSSWQQASMEHEEGGVAGGDDVPRVRTAAAHGGGQDAD
jgi:hypothetical protein